MRRTQFKEPFLALFYVINKWMILIVNPYTSGPGCILMISMAATDPHSLHINDTWSQLDFLLLFSNIRIGHQLPFVSSHASLSLNPACAE